MYSVIYEQFKELIPGPTIVINYKIVATKYKHSVGQLVLKIVQSYSHSLLLF